MKDSLVDKRTESLIPVGKWFNVFINILYNTFLYLAAGKNEKDEGAKQNRHNLPKSIRLRANILVNLRPAAGIQVIIIQLALLKSSCYVYKINLTRVLYKTNGSSPVLSN